MAKIICSMAIIMFNFNASALIASWPPMAAPPDGPPTCGSADAAILIPFEVKNDRSNFPDHIQDYSRFLENRDQSCFLIFTEAWISVCQQMRICKLALVNIGKVFFQFGL
jgi:hypothetical protein